jgi:hypothetical protein
MWTTLIRQLVLFIFTKRGKRVLTFVGLMLLCFLTALLLDSGKYLTAGFTGILTGSALVALAIQYVRQRKQQRERVRQELEKAERRAAATQARTGKFEKAKATVADAARAASNSAANIANAAKAASNNAANMAKTASNTAANMANAAKAGLDGARNRLSFWRAKDRDDARPG